MRRRLRGWIPHRPGVEVGEDLLGLPLELVGELLDEPRATERIGHVHDAGFLGDHLLGAQRQARGVLGRQGQGFVERVGVQALGPAEHAGQRLDGDAYQVDLGLLRREGHAGGLGVEAQLGRTARRSRRSGPASSAPRSGGRPGTWRSPRRSRCGH